MGVAFDQTQQIPAMKDGLAGLAGLAVVGAAFGAFHPNLHGSWEFLWDDTEHLGRRSERSKPRGQNQVSQGLSMCESRLHILRILDV